MAKKVCPTCGSPDPAKHPAMQFEGEVQPCADPWHVPPRNTAGHIVKWGDAQQYRQDPHFANGEQDEHGGDYGVEPRVTLLSMTPQPLAAVAAMAFMYEGRVIRDLSELTDLEIKEKWYDVLSTHLDTPLEAVQLHFLIEGVDRSFTHQLVRQRVGAAYAQESLRFAVVDDLMQATTLPPSLAGTVPARDWVGSDGWVNADGEATLRQTWRAVWDQAMHTLDGAYTALVDAGMPAEEARGLLPHATATRVVYVTNLRALKDHAGNRLCTQAQFHWRQVFALIIDAIRNYGLRFDFRDAKESLTYDNWQYEAIADSKLFRPVCYQLGRCPFKASFDRACNIRERVDIRAKHGATDPDQWHKPFIYDNPDYKKTDEGMHRPYVTSEGIDPAEWLANPGAARA